jgi:curli biogenesis system outer membrane secretion channel CsgG
MGRYGVLFTLLMLAAMALASCAPTATVVSTGGPTIQQAREEPATGDKLRIAVMNFENKTLYHIGDGMRAMLTSCLFETGEFIVIEREMLQDVLMEQKLGVTGVVSDETAVPVGEVEGAEVLIFGVVTDFEPAAKGIGSSFGGMQQNHIAMDLRLVDARTSRVISTTTVEGKATDVYLDTAALQYIGAEFGKFYPTLAVWQNTPMGTAIRICLDQAVGYIVQQTR